MLLNNTNLTTLNVAFKAAFMAGLGMAATQWKQIATEVPSTTGAEEYGWLGQLKGMREWIGDRQINAIGKHGYTIRNKDWEDSVSVPRPAIEDDQYGVYTPLFQELGRAAEAHPDELVFGALAGGFAAECYDGQYFFDTDHPVRDAEGQTTSVSNHGGGASTPWFILDNSRAIKPILLQMRKRPVFTPMIADKDENVFSRNEFVWGVDGRWNVGYGFWQMAYGSKQSLDETNLAAAIAALGSFKGDHGRPLGMRATHLVVPPSLELAAEKLVVATFGANGSSNVLAGKLKVVVAPWLA